MTTRAAATKNRNPRPSRPPVPVLARRCQGVVAFMLAGATAMTAVMVVPWYRRTFFYRSGAASGACRSSSGLERAGGLPISEVQ
jgi:hypothetical protein